MNQLCRPLPWSLVPALPVIMPRRKPFSNKQKKQQLQQKRQRKRDKCSSEEKPAESRDQDHSSSSDGPDLADGLQDPVQSQETVQGSDSEAKIVDISRLNQQPTVGSKVIAKSYDPNRYRLHFEKERKEEVEKRKHEAKTVTIVPVPETQLEVKVEDIYHPGSELDIPKRPPWSYSMSKEEVERQEEDMFERYLKNIYSHHSPLDLSYFEHNLETWRQLWRVLEISDVILLITDVRHPALHFSPALYHYVVKDLKKQLVMVLNKVDLVPPQVAVAWRHYFLAQFPQLDVICFTSYPNQDVSMEPSKKVRLKAKRHHRGRLPSAVGPRELLKVVEDMYRGKVDLSGWREKLDSSQDTPVTASDATNTTTTTTECPSDVDSEEEEPVTVATTMVDSSPLVRDDIADTILTIGMVGHPNVGKSSLLNGLMGKKLVSTSRTPGHTKHFQTIYLTSTVRLCDCPGLVFPSLVNKQLQILSGIYPIAQVREPYTAVGYLAQRLPLVQLLKLQHPSGIATVGKRTAGRRVGDFELDDPNIARLLALRDSEEEERHVRASQEEEWTAWDICDAWAEKRGYYTSRAARPDTYRSANSLLRLAVDGKICLYFLPSSYFKDRAIWEGHPDVSEIMELQRRGMSRGESVADNETAAGTAQSRETERGGEKQGGNKFAMLLTMEDSDT